MTRRSSWLTFFLSLAGVLLAPGRPAYAETGSKSSDAPDYKWEAGLFFSYLTGDYGQDRTSEVYYASLMLKRYLGWGDVTLTIPYLDIPENGVTFVGGTPESDGTSTGGSGLGDIILKGRLYAVEQDGLLPFIDLVGSVKFPTADPDKGLGTGELDFTVLSEFTWRLGDSPWLALADFGYTFVGKPDDMDVKNRWLYSAGLAYELNPQLTLSGYLDGRTAIFEGNTDPLSVLVLGQYKIYPDLRFDTMLEFGLNKGAPDFGVTLGLRKRI
jgi:hypothetical protein